MRAGEPARGDAIDRPLHRAVFLDKDGTLIIDVPYNVDPDQIVLAPGAEAGLTRLAAAGYRFVVVSNQSGVARGRFGVEALGPVEARVRELLAEFGVELAGFWFCPHHPGGSVSAYAVACDCRKPAPGMLLDAARVLGIDLARSWLIGDIPADVEAAHRAGCRAVLIAAGATPVSASDVIPDHTAPDLDAAATLILAADGG